MEVTWNNMLICSDSNWTISVTASKEIWENYMKWDAAFHRFCQWQENVCVCFGYLSSKTIVEREQGIEGTAKKVKILCAFCDKHPAIQIITLLGEIKYFLEPSTQCSNSILAAVKLIATSHLAFV